MNKRILVVDDEKAVRKSFQLALRDLAYEVDCAENGKLAMELFQSRNYDLVYLDLKMPVMNGVETLLAIRKLNTHVPVYIVTAFHQEFFDQLATARKAEASFELVMKPLGMKEIASITKGILEGPVLLEKDENDA